MTAPSRGLGAGPTHAATPNGAPPRPQSAGHSFTPGQGGRPDTGTAPRSFTPSHSQESAERSTRSAGDNNRQPAHRFGETPQSHGTANAEHAERRFGSNHDAHAAPVRSRSAARYQYHGHEYARFRVARYHWPAGFFYVHYGIHGFLPRAFWLEPYWIDDYATYDLAAPPPEQRWVRYGPDLLLIQLDTGEVVDSVPGAFEEDADAPDQPADAPGY